MIAAILAAITAGGVPAITAAAGGAVSLVGGAISLFLDKYKIYFILAGLAGLVAASVGVTLWITDLQHMSEAYKELKAETDTLTKDMGCAGDERALVCFQRQRREIAEAHSAELTKQADTAAREKGVLQGQISKLQSDLQESDAAIDAESDSDDGPLPKTLTNAWARERAKRGVK